MQKVFNKIPCQCITQMKQLGVEVLALPCNICASIDKSCSEGYQILSAQMIVVGGEIVKNYYSPISLSN